MHIRHQSRPAGTLVEFAVVAPVTFLLILGVAIGGMGIHRYHQVAQLARAASRWASVHGTLYAADTGKTAATSQDVYDQAIVPNTAGLDTSHLTYSVTWNASNSPYHSATVNGKTVNVANTVTVTVNYSWIPEAYLGGVTLSSTSVTVMSH